MNRTSLNTIVLLNEVLLEVTYGQVKSSESLYLF